MADVKQLKINNSLYNIKDETARNTANAALPKSGGTMTGGLQMANGAAVRLNRTYDSTVRPANDIWGTGIHIYDVNGDLVGNLRDIYRSSTGTLQLQLDASRKIDGSTVENYLRLNVEEDGTKSVSVSDKAQWRNAIGASNGIWPVSLGGTGASSAGATACANIGALPITGGTLTDTLKIKVAGSNADAGSIPESVSSQLAFIDENSGNYIGFLRGYQSFDGETRCMYYVSKGSGNNRVLHGITLSVDNAGNAKVSATHPDAWTDGLLGDTGWLPFTNSSTFSGSIYYRKIGRQVIINFNGITSTTAIAAGASKQLGTIQTAFRPTGQSVSAYCGNPSERGMIQINTAGAFTLYAGTSAFSTSSSIRGTLSYFTD